MDSPFANMKIPPSAWNRGGLKRYSPRVFVLAGACLLLLFLVIFESSGQTHITKHWTDAKSSVGSWSGESASLMHQASSEGPASSSHPAQSVLTSHNEVFNNGSLGFGKIYVLSMARRTDKRDALALAASMTGLQLNFRDGPTVDDIDHKATPPIHFDLDAQFFQKGGEVGCWRGHMNILREIVQSGVATALILEDDIDWDLSITAQAEMVATAARNLSSHIPTPTNGAIRTFKSQSESAYGSGWDMLHLGHCAGTPPGDEWVDYHTIIPDDSTVPPSTDMSDMTLLWLDQRTKCFTHEGRGTGKDGVECTRLQRNERIVQYAAGPMCTFGYAVSRRGALKMLARLGGLSTADVYKPIDMQIIDMCTEPGDSTSQRDRMHCLTVSPPLILKHVPRGPATGSDIRKANDPNAYREIGRTNGAVWPTMMNVEALIAGRPPQSQYVWNETAAEYRLREKDEWDVL